MNFTFCLFYLHSTFQLMLDLGIIKLASPGTFHLLPLGVRALEKLKSVIDKEMHKINAQRLALPTLTPAELWEKTGWYIY